MERDRLVEQNISLPETGELTVCTATRIHPYGVYVTLDEYNSVEGLIHISELSSRWVKNIRDHVREDQKVVLKVLRVDPVKLHIDLSLRRVNERERRSKLLQWKRENRGKKLLDLTAEKIGISYEEAYEKIGIPLEDHFGSIYRGLERAVEDGEGILIKQDIPAPWAQVLTELIKDKIRVPQVKIGGILELSCSRPDGISVLRKAFKKATGLKKPKDAEIHIFTLGAPKYRIEVLAKNYKVAEKLLDRAVSEAIKTVQTVDGEGLFIRKRKGG